MVTPPVVGSSAPVNPVPLMVTVVPTGPLAGLKGLEAAMTGWLTWKVNPVLV